MRTVLSVRKTADGYEVLADQDVNGDEALALTLVIATAKIRTKSLPLVLRLRAE